jgi:copper homeostasis protein
VDVTRLHDVPTAERVLAQDEKAVLFEVCASSPMDVEHAAAAGADRVELCAHWSCGGLTPPEVDIRASVDWGLPIHALIRPRAGHFVYSEKEKTWMMHQIESALQSGASRAVIGATHRSGHLDLPWLAQAVEIFGAHRLVIHRACDLSPDWAVDAKGLAALGLTRILTSGGTPVARDGLQRIQGWVDEGFQVVVASGVRPVDLPLWSEMGVEAVHASCRARREVSLSLFDGTTHPVDRQQVDTFVRSLRACAE